MGKSEILLTALKNNTQSFSSIFEDADIKIEGDEDAYAIFYNNNNGEGKFEAISYITQYDQSFKNSFLSQNDAIFIGYASEHHFQTENFDDFVLTRVEQLLREEDYVAFEKEEMLQREKDEQNEIDLK